MEESKLYRLLWAIVVQLPSLITLAVCMFFVVRRWKRHPKVSLLALIGLALIFLHGPVFSVLFIWLPDLLLSRVDGDTLSTFFTAIGWTFNVALVIAFTPLLAAVFVWRRRSRTT